MKKILLWCGVLLVVMGSAVAQQSPSGQVAITGADGNIYLYDVGAGSLTPVTDDADGQNKFYLWPTWASDGQLAYFGRNTNPDNFYSFAIFVRSPQGISKGIYASEDEIFTYAYWSPGNCSANSGSCRDLAVLYTTRDGLAVRNVRSAGSYEIYEVDTGAPFYWDWSPDGRYMFWARFGRTLEIYDAETREVIQTLPDQQGLQQAVDWSPVDNRLLSAVVNSGGTSDLVIIDENERTVLSGGLEDIIAFEWSPDAQNVALLNRATGDLSVVNVTSGQESALPARLVLAFFWSPDSSKLAYLSLNTSGGGGSARLVMQQTPTLRWFVYDFASKTNTPLSTFIPTQDMVYYLSFFDQFARSHRLWSPDSRYLVYGEMLSSGNPAVSLVDVLNPSNAPVKIGDGTIGIFSWQ